MTLQHHEHFDCMQSPLLFHVFLEVAVAGAWRSLMRAQKSAVAC